MHLFNCLHEIMGLDPAEQEPYKGPYLFKINDEPVTVELQDVVKMYLPDDAPPELAEALGYDDDSVPDANYRILLSAQIDIPSSVTNFEVAYREILKLNYFGLGTGGGAFGLHPEDNRVLAMHYLIPTPMRDMTTQVLGVFISGFLTKAQGYKEVFTQAQVIKPVVENRIDRFQKFI